MTAWMDRWRSSNPESFFNRMTPEAKAVFTAVVARVSGLVMEPCCLYSFINKDMREGFVGLRGHGPVRLREGFRLAEPGDIHACAQCGKVFELQRNPKMNASPEEAHAWRLVEGSPE